jgi:hypothetical protein
VKKIIRNKFLKDYEQTPIFEDEVGLPYPDDMKVEMFYGNPIKGYLLEQKLLSIKVNYNEGSFKVPIRNYKTMKDFVKKMCRMYDLGRDMVVTDEEGRVYNLNIILKYCLEEVWICINNNGILIRAELKRFEYEIMKNDHYHSFDAMIFSAWNYSALKNYICLMIGGKSRLTEIYVDGNLWVEENMAANVTRMKIKALIRKENVSEKFIPF